LTDWFGFLKLVFITVLAMSDPATQHLLGLAWFGLIWKLTGQLGGQPHNSSSLPAANIWYGLEFDLAIGRPATQ
jgi:hypothetical protein